MLKYLIQVVQVSLTPAILLAMIFAVVHLGNNQKHNRWLIKCVGGSVAAAFILTILKHTTTLINREYFNIGILSFAITAEIIFYVFAWRLFYKKTPLLSEGIWGVVNAMIAASLLFYSLPDIFLYPTGFVLAGQSIFNTDFLLKLIGYLTGLLIVILSGYALFKTAAGLSLRLVRTLLTAGLFLNMVNQIAIIVQILLARRIIPMQEWLFEIILPIINYNDYFLYGLMALTLILPALLWIKSQHPEETYTNPAEHRKIRAVSLNRRRFIGLMAAGYVYAVMSLTVLKEYDEKEAELSPAEPITIMDGEIVISLDDINDGRLHRFSHIASDGTEVRFIVIKKNEAAFGVGLDACNICGPTGYYEHDGRVICKLCGVAINISTIGFQGGCNPVPLAYSIQDGYMLVQGQDLEDEKGRF